MPVLTFDTFRGRAAVNVTTACRRVATVGGKAEIGKAESRSAGKSQVGQTRQEGGINWGVREQPTLETKRLVLRPLMAKDDLSVRELANDPRIASLSIWPMRG